jgi:putative flippase GtrA
VAYAGNALGTYRHARPKGLRPYAVFFAVNIAGAAVQLLCLAISHYCLGLTSQRADTVSGAGIGMALATVLRFWGTRTFVFRTEGRVGSWTG